MSRWGYDGHRHSSLASRLRVGEGERETDAAGAGPSGVGWLAMVLSILLLAG